MPAAQPAGRGGSSNEHRPLGILCEEFGSYSTVFVQRQLDALSEFRPFVGCWVRSNRERFDYEPTYVLRSSVESHPLARWVERWLPARHRFVSRLEACEQLRARLNQHFPKLLHIHFGWMAARVQRELARARIPYTVVVHGSDVALTGSIRWSPYARRLRSAFQGAAQVLCASRALRAKALELGAPDDRTRVHYLGVPLAKRLATPDREGRLRILANGRHVESKGHRFLIEAVARLLERGLDLELVLIGEGALTPEIRGQIARLGLEPRTRLLSRLGNPEVYAELTQAHVFAQPSIQLASGQGEGLGLAVQEAMSAGLPVVATRTGGLPESVLEGETGLLVEGADSVALADALEALVRDPPRRTAMGLAGRRRVEEHFDLDRQNAGLVSLLRPLIRG